MGVEPYVRPAVEIISAEELESIASAVGSGPAPPPPPPPTSYNVHILFAPIILPAEDDDDEPFVLPFDHAALFISYGGSDYGYFYSFAADPNDIFAVISGTDGYLSTACDSDEESEHSQHQILYQDIVDTGMVYTDFIPEEAHPTTKTYGEDKNYYRAINFTVPSGNEIYLRDAAEAIRQRQDGQEYDEYELLWKNCYDKASEILETRGIAVQYDAIYTLAFIEGAIIIIAQGFLLLAIALEISFIAGTAAEGVLNIPNMVFDNFTQVVMNGNPLPPPPGQESKREFGAR